VKYAYCYFRLKNIPFLTRLILPMNVARHNREKLYYNATMKTILIVEDDEQLAKTYENALTQRDVKVITVLEGKDGLRVCLETKPDLVILDLMLPDQDGFTTLQQIKNNPEINQIPVIISSNLSRSEDRDKAKSLGAMDYIIKGHYSTEQFAEKISSYLQ